MLRVTTPTLWAAPERGSRRRHETARAVSQCIIAVALTVIVVLLDHEDDMPDEAVTIRPVVSTAGEV